MSIDRLRLKDVTLCAVSGVLHEPTNEALKRCLAHAEFGDAVFITNRYDSQNLAPVRVSIVEGLDSRESYSRFLLTQLASHIQTPFVLLIQWDGFVVRPENWTDEFLQYDYIGAPWPQFPADRSVGNGGFSLRSRRLLEACANERFNAFHPEDLCICHENRALLERSFGIRFAPPTLAARLSYERKGQPRESFGFHGVFNMLEEIGGDEFLRVLGSVDLAHLGLREQVEIYQLLQANGFSQEDIRHVTGGLPKLVRRHWRKPTFWRMMWG